MKISAFSYVRNGFTYGVPFIESIKSVLPLCSEFVIAVGDSTDGTREAIENIGDPKIKIIDTVWDDSMTKGGKIFAQQCNIAFTNISKPTDWVIHIQADEVLHENDYPLILKKIEEANQYKEIEGLLQPFIHFWGDYNSIRNSRRVHKNEIRIFKYNPNIRAYIDSQGFRKFNSVENYENGFEKGEKLRVLALNAPVYHYSSVKSKRTMSLKANNFVYYYGHTEKKLEKAPKDEFNYNTVDRVTKFKGSHPKVMAEAIANYDFVFNHDTSQAVWKKKDKYLQPIEDLLNIRFGEYKNYILIKNPK
ncbi:hypothetical protein ACM39_15495 [Chryseobacterium sp. FH2]|uniref:hypothetical protein n=1 Tax=Chryseobacterium sp. FH2 TaxID=1674291 RepID=UPI00065AD2B9|nr:hypothetical protein [Chryseobacterium sp. FH2]KMQ67175.1 hypothetical protein ACM39_15495 [Chryseobacterium sp. FH2]